MMAARGYLDTATIPRKAKTTTAVLRVETVKNTNPPPNKSDASWVYVLFAERRDDASSCGCTAPGKGKANRARCGRLQTGFFLRLLLSDEVVK